MTTRRLRRVASTLLALLAGHVSPASGQEAFIQPGTSETVAGPGFCSGSATVDETSRSVGGVAADSSDGSFHYEAGPPGSGVVVRVSGDGTPQAIPTGLVLGRRERRLTDEPSRSGRLASDGHGGVVIATAEKLVHVPKGLGPVGIAGGIQLDPGGSGDAGPAATARFAGIKAIASDHLGSVFVADADRSVGTFRVRVVNRSDQVMTLFGGTPREHALAPGAIASVADGFTSAVGKWPALSVGAGRLYVATATSIAPMVPKRTGTIGAEVRVLNLSGSPLVAHGVTVEPAGIRTVVGAGSGPSTGASPIASVAAMSTDGKGDLFLADEVAHRVLRLDPAGELTVFAGAVQPASDAKGFNGNERPASGARLNYPFGVDVGTAGRVYISDRSNGQVRVVDEAGTIRAAPGNGLSSRWACQLPDDRALPGGPQGLVVDRAGNIYMALSATGQVKRLDPSGHLTTVAGMATPNSQCPVGQPTCRRSMALGDERMAIRATLGSPVGLAMARSGAMYVLDRVDGRVYLINVSHRTIVVHGLRVRPGGIRVVTDDNRSQHASDIAPRLLGNPLAVDSDENLFIADADRVRRVDRSGRISTYRFFGETTSDPANCCARITGVATDAFGDLYIAQTRPGRVFVVNRTASPKSFQGRLVAPGETAAVAGNGQTGFDGDGGPALEAQLGDVSGVAVDTRGNLYVATPIEAQDQSVRRVAADGMITTAVGTGRIGFNGDGLSAGLTALSGPTSLAFDGCENLLVADSQNDRVRRFRFGTCDGPTPGATVLERGVVRSSWIVAVATPVTVLLAGFTALSYRRRRRSRTAPGGDVVLHSRASLETARNGAPTE